MLGGAVGGALGAPVEFMSRREILDRFGPQGITRFAPVYGRAGAITDDTQMTLFTLEGLLRAEVRYAARGICNPFSVIHRAYFRWHATQTGPQRTIEGIDGFLASVPELWSRRAPGTTCLSALQDVGTISQPARNDSKGAGAIMRVAPIGLAEVRDGAFSFARQVAALTHGHVTGQVAAGWFAAWIEAIAKRPSLPAGTAASCAWDICRGEAPELDDALARAFALAAKGRVQQAPLELREGWVAEEAAAIALWCVLTAPDPMEALRLAVNIDGDSDTTGCLVGQVMGALHGPGWIPAGWLDQLELRSVIDQLAEDAMVVFWNMPSEGSPEFDAIWERYPGW